MKLEINEGGFN